VLSGWNLEMGRVEHSHGNDEWHEMVEAEPHADSADNDDERDWSRGRIFRCTTCEDEIRVVMPSGAGGGR
jgi:hypothetical protein